MSNSDASGPRSRAPHGAADASPPPASIAIAELRDLLSRATAGEWTVAQMLCIGGMGPVVIADLGQEISPVGPMYADASTREANAALIAAAKNSMAALLDAYEALAEIRRLASIQERKTLLCEVIEGIAAEALKETSDA